MHNINGKSTVSLFPIMMCLSIAISSDITWKQLRMLVQEGGQVQLSTYWEKWQNRIFCLSLLAMACSDLKVTLTHAQNITSLRNFEDSVAEIDTNSIFKTLWLDHLLALASSILFLIDTHSTSCFAFMWHHYRMLSDIICTLKFK